MISFAQNFEDVILNRVFQDQKNGFYIDAGAMDPILHSVTKWFYDQGWSGINVEPNPWFYQKLLADRPRDINLNLALGEREEEKTFYVFEQEGLSTFDAPSHDRFVEQGFAARQMMVRVNTLEAICQQYATQPIDFLKVDCEGWEGPVLKSADWNRFRPVVVVVEATEPGTTIPAWSDWEPWFIENACYDMVYFDGLNRFYLRRESAELRSRFHAPPNVFDDFVLSSTVFAQQSNQALQQSTQALQQEQESLAHQLAALGAELSVQANNYQSRIAEMEKQRAELLNAVEAKTTEIGSLSNDLEQAQNNAARLDNKLRENRLWLGKLSQEIAARKRR